MIIIASVPILTPPPLPLKEVLDVPEVRGCAQGFLGASNK